MALTTKGKNKQANAINYDKARLHTGAPGENGTANLVRALTAQEVTDSKPAYADQAIGFAAAVDGLRDSSNQPVFPIPAGETVSHYSLWDGADCVDVGTLPVAESFGDFGNYTLTDVDINNT